MHRWRRLEHAKRCDSGGEGRSAYRGARRRRLTDVARDWSTVSSSTMSARRQRWRLVTCFRVSCRHLRRLPGNVVADIRLIRCPVGPLGRPATIRLHVRTILLLARYTTHLTIWTIIYRTPAALGSISRPAVLLSDFCGRHHDSYKPVDKWIVYTYNARSANTAGPVRRRGGYDSVKEGTAGERDR